MKTTRLECTEEIFKTDLRYQITEITTEERIE